MQIVFGAAQDTRWSVETVYAFTVLRFVAMVAGLESVSTNNSWTVTVGADFQIVWSGSWSRSDSCCCMATWKNPGIDDLPGVVVEDRDGWMNGWLFAGEVQKHRNIQKLIPVMGSRFLGLRKRPRHIHPSQWHQVALESCRCGSCYH